MMELMGGLIVQNFKYCD